MSRSIPQEGDRTEVSVLHGYRLEQHRPFECRTAGYDRDGRWTFGCKCGECGGHTTVHPGTVERVIYWADNSIEAEVRCDDGELRLQRLVAPHGDVC